MSNQKQWYQEEALSSFHHGPAAMRGRAFRPSPPRWRPPLSTHAAWAGCAPSRCPAAGGALAGSRCSRAGPWTWTSQTSRACASSSWRRRARGSPARRGYGVGWAATAVGGQPCTPHTPPRSAHLARVRAAALLALLSAVHGDGSVGQQVLQLQRLHLEWGVGGRVRGEVSTGRARVVHDWTRLNGNGLWAGRGSTSSPGRCSTPCLGR